MKKYLMICSLLFSCFSHSIEPPKKNNNTRQTLYVASREGRLTTAYHYGHYVDIFSAVKKGDMKLAQELARENPDVIHARDAYGNSPLHWAVKYSFIELVQWLLDKGVNPNAKNHWNQTPLFFVDWENGVKTAQVLLEKDTDTSVKDKNGFSSLDFTFWKWHKRTARRLLGKSACILIFKK